MRHTNLKAYVLAALMALGAVPALAAESADLVAVPIHRSELITTSTEMGEVIVADPDVADVFVHGKNKVSLIGKKLGTTTVRLFDVNSKMIRRVDVQVTYDLPAIRKAIRDFLPNERIGVEMVNTSVALTGEVSSAQSAKRAVQIAEQFLIPKRAADEFIAADLAENERNEILNLMTVTAGQQVMLRIRVGEIQRSALKNLGLNLQAVRSSGDVLFSIGTGSGIGTSTTIGSTAGFGSFGVPETSRGAVGLSYLNSSGNGISGLIDAMERDGMFKILAEPNLTSLSGEKAEFLAGGEFPIPVPQGDQTITIEYKPFGVGVEFTPYVLSENRIRIEVQPEVSEISNENTISVGGFTVPSFTTRRAKTTVELAPGESFMIAGLLRDQLASTIEQLPGVGEIPVLSSLFRSTSYQRNETELVLAVTPYLVDPIKSSDVKLPTDDFRPANDMEMFFYGALGSMSGNASRVSQSPNLEGPIGFMVD